MHQVLTLNALNDSVVTSDRADKNTLGKFSNKLDKICRKNKIPIFSGLFDYTHYSLDRSGIPLPEGMSLNDEFMAKHGKWFNAKDVYNDITRLNALLKSQPARFGFFNNQYLQILLELEECINFTEIAKTKGYMVNISKTIPGGGCVHGVGYGHGFQ